MKLTLLIPTLLFVATALPALAQEESTGFADASASIQQRLQNSIEELNALREQVAEEKIPLSRKLNELERELTDVRLEFQQTTRILDSRTLDLSNLRSEINTRREEATYLSNLLSEYVRNFESRLHISEIQRYEEALEAARLAPENTNLSEQEIYQAQADLLLTSLGRLEDALGGTKFEGTAVDPNGLVQPGEFVLLGPSALFRSSTGEFVGTAEQRLGSLEPTIITFNDPETTEAAASMISTGNGLFPLDPTMGNAQKIEETEETLVEHMQKGGPVMVPILGLAAIALLVALWKWVGLLTTRIPSRRHINELLEAVAKKDNMAAKQKAVAMGGPVGAMLSTGVEHINEPRELIEEVMYEIMLTTRLKIERFLPFIAISAASAPLLGLLGTVGGIINTFKLITIFGSGDVKTLSGGISEALITTEFGLIVAIPSLILHALLSRKGKGVINQMEKAAVAFVNEVSKSRTASLPKPEAKEETPVGSGA